MPEPVPHPASDTHRHPIDRHPLRSLFTRLPGVTTHRSSSWDRTGGNDDFIRVAPHTTATLLDTDGPGCVTHVYTAMGGPELTDFRDAILRCYWDGEAEPSVEVPLGDFFAIAHGRVRTFTSHFVTVHPGMGASQGLTAYFPMPFATHARITLENRADTVLGGPIGSFWFHIEHERYGEPLPEDTLRFHAQYRQARPLLSATEPANTTLHAGLNLDGADNYVVLDAAGAGQMVGLVLEVENHGGGWYGEGDDMVFVDGETWPPSIHGTGHEEVFSAGACPTAEFHGPYTGFHLVERPDFDGLVGMYRWYVPDPIHFSSSIRWTIEHGHANNYANGYASVAFWYQTEPHRPFDLLPERDAMRPPLPDDYPDLRIRFLTAMARLVGPTETMHRMDAVAAPWFRGDFASCMAAIEALDLGA